MQYKVQGSVIADGVLKLVDEVIEAEDKPNAVSIVTIKLIKRYKMINSLLIDLQAIYT